jgi:glycosyltransferase involved in cell wall biosynthesis
MKLSIITINYNNSTGLRKTIESVVNQTFLDFEYIIIDGGSSDGSSDIIREFDSKISNWVSETDSGIYNAMNKGIAMASGDYLQFLNSGDWLVDDNILQRIFDNVGDFDLIYGDMKMIMADGSMKNFIARTGRDITFLTFYFSFLPHPSSFIRRELFMRFGLYDERLKIVADWKFFLIAFGLNESTVIYKNCAVCCYDLLGISSVQSELAEKERELVISELLPAPIISDFNFFKNDMRFLMNIKKYPMLNRIYCLLVYLLDITMRVSNKINNSLHRLYFF